MIRARAALAILLGGCAPQASSPPQSSRPLVDLHTYDLKKPGITCMRGTRLDEDRGCTSKVGPFEAELRVRRRDEMGESFVLISALYALDGRLAYSWKADADEAAPAPRTLAVAALPGSAATAEPAAQPAEPQAAPEPEPGGKAFRIETKRELPVLDIGVLPGEHELQAILIYRGQGYGVFAYLRGYKFEVRSRHTFVVASGSITEVTVLSHEKGGITTPLEERPAVRWIGP